MQPGPLWRCETGSTDKACNRAHCEGVQPGACNRAHCEGVQPGPLIIRHATGPTVKVCSRAHCESRQPGPDGCAAQFSATLWLSVSLVTSTDWSVPNINDGDLVVGSVYMYSGTGDGRTKIHHSKTDMYLRSCFPSTNLCCLKLDSWCVHVTIDTNYKHSSYVSKKSSNYNILECPPNYRHHSCASNKF